MVSSSVIIAFSLLASFSAAGTNYVRENPVDVIVNGVKSGVINARQQVDSMVRGFKSNDGHPTADVLKAFITGLDGQIDNGIGIVADLLSPVTFGASHALEGAILGPWFQSVTDGVEVAVANLVGMPIDAVLGAPIQSLANNMSKMIAQANALSVDSKIVHRMAQTQQKLARFAAKRHHRRELAVLDGVQNSVSTARQTIDSLVEQLEKTDKPSPAAINGIVAGFNAQIDNAVGNINDLLAPYAVSLTNGISGALLNTFFQSVSTGAEAIISKFATLPVDVSTTNSMNALAKSIQNAANFAGKYNLQEQQTQLMNINHRIHLLTKQ